jgi:CMP-N-acetylneuraminic acid synthetase
MDKKTFAFIPARAGSLGIKNKNLQKVSGISLVKRSYDHAISSEIFGKIIISTDSFEIISEITSTFLYAEFKQFSENSLVEISSNTFLHKRRIDQAESLSPIREVIFDLANNLEFDQLWMLQPTSPFRTIPEFSSIMNLQSQLKETNKKWSSIVSCRPVGGMHPDRMFKLSGEYAIPLVDQSNGDNVPRQLLEKLYVKDGAFYILKRENLVKNIMLGTEVVPYVRHGTKTINIDEPDDLSIAQLIGEA